jgi:hypothetical protein
MISFHGQRPFYLQRCKIGEEAIELRPFPDPHQESETNYDDNDYGVKKDDSNREPPNRTLYWRQLARIAECANSEPPVCP